MPVGGDLHRADEPAPAAVAVIVPLDHIILRHFPSVTMQFRKLRADPRIDAEMVVAAEQFQQIPRGVVADPFHGRERVVHLLRWSLYVTQHLHITLLLRDGAAEFEQVRCAVTAGEFLPQPPFGDAGDPVRGREGEHAVAERRAEFLHEILRLDLRQRPTAVRGEQRLHHILERRGGPEHPSRLFLRHPPQMRFLPAERVEFLQRFVHPQHRTDDVLHPFLFRPCESDLVQRREMERPVLLCDAEMEMFRFIE